MSASSTLKRTPETEDADDKPLRYIIGNLEQAYGTPENNFTHDPLDMLVQIILSQATSDTNSNRAYASLKTHFPTWDDALAADETALADAIRSGGLANQKARTIKSVLAQIKNEHGVLDLSTLR